MTIMALMVGAFHVSGQYISGVSIPDSSFISLTDASHPSVKYAASISADDLKSHLTILSADDFEGREAGTEGIEKAATYISDHFKTLGLKATGVENSYFQEVAFTWTKWKAENMSFSVNGNTYKHLQDYIAFPHQNSNIELNSDEVLFLGYGIDDPQYSDYKKNEVRGKVILIYEGEPLDSDSISHITNSKTLSEWSTNRDKKLKIAKEHGVKEVLIIPNDFKKFMAENRRKVIRFYAELGDKTKEDSPYANASFISTNIAREIMGERLKKVVKSRDRSKKKGKACEVPMPANISISKNRDQRSLVGKNILGFIEGSDKKEELIVISAHYDHIGMRGDDVYNGANDNGSGTSTVLELAEAFKKAKDMGNGPRRSILCLLVTAEEKGLLGSEYYSERPVFPLENTVCNINIDMVGRSDKKYSENPNYIYVIGSDRLSTDLHKINEEMNQKFSRLILDYKYNDENDRNRYYYRSDHYNFARKGIPAIFFFNGVHQDYHRISDTVEKMNFEQMASTAKLIFHTAWEVANREDRLIVDGEIR
jgi:hypothetical protein